MVTKSEQQVYAYVSFLMDAPHVGHCIYIQDLENPNEFYVLIDSHESKSPEVFKVRQKRTLPILSSLGSWHQHITYSQ